MMKLSPFPTNDANFYFDLVILSAIGLITQPIHSSIRIYNENGKHPLILAEKDLVEAPVAFAKFPKELFAPPRSRIEKRFKIKSRT